MNSLLFGVLSMSLHEVTTIQHPKCVEMTIFFLKEKQEGKRETVIFVGGVCEAW